MGFGTHLTWGENTAKHRVRFSPPYTYARHVASPFLRAFRPEQEKKNRIGSYVEEEWERGTIGEESMGE